MSTLFKKGLVILHLALMLYLISVNAFFIHSHTLPDGTTIVHAHPYNKSKENKYPNEKHQHRFFEYLALNNVMHYMASVFEFNLTYFTEVLPQQITTVEPQAYVKITSDFNNRAPPIQ